MKIWWKRISVAVAVGGLWQCGAAADPVSSAFLYQGQLSEQGVPMNGAIGLGVTMWDAPTGGSILGGEGFPGVVVENGLFTVELNRTGLFGPNAFNGQGRWLQFTVNGSILQPRQPLLAAPYAQRSLRSNTADFATLAGNATTADSATTAQSAASVVGIDGHSLNGPGGTPVDALTVNAAGTVTVGQNYLLPSGKLGINVAAPVYPLEVAAAGNCEVVLRTTDNGGNGWNLVSAGQQGAAEDFAFQVVDRSINRARLTILKNSGMTVVDTLQIRGGADLAEPFAVARGAAPAPGSVMCIDAENPGQLRPSTRAYDRSVAGVVSGAGGVSAGVTLRHEDTLADGNHPVALAGRVYVLADAEANGPIQPGDLLTTSETPAHAMKASDEGRRAGAVIGKAMTALPAGKGLVLVLVSLQ